MKLKCANGPIEDETRGLLILLLILPSFLIPPHSLTHSLAQRAHFLAVRRGDFCELGERERVVRARAVRTREGRKGPSTAHGTAAAVGRYMPHL